VVIDQLIGRCDVDVLAPRAQLTDPRGCNCRSWLWSQIDCGSWLPQDIPSKARVHRSTRDMRISILRKPWYRLVVHMLRVTNRPLGSFARRYNLPGTAHPSLPSASNHTSTIQTTSCLYSSNSHNSTPSRTIQEKHKQEACRETWSEMTRVVKEEAAA
jgi:hypothetical protein